jgi:hypothetical protein
MNPDYESLKCIGLKYQNEDILTLPILKKISISKINLQEGVTSLVDSNKISLNDNFLITREANLNTLKIWYLHNTTKFFILKEHLFQISDFKIMK